MEELRASLAQKLAADQPGPVLAVQVRNSFLLLLLRLSARTWQEAGIARLVFEEDGSAFSGVLINGDEESFALAGRLQHQDSPVRSPHPPSSNFPRSLPDLQSTSDGLIRVIPSEPGGSGSAGLAEAVYEVTLVDCSSGAQYLLKGAELRHKPDRPDSLTLVSDQLRYRLAFLRNCKAGRKGGVAGSKRRSSWWVPGPRWRCRSSSATTSPPHTPAYTWAP